MECAVPGYEKQSLKKHRHMGQIPPCMVSKQCIVQHRTEPSDVSKHAKWTIIGDN